MEQRPRPLKAITEILPALRDADITATSIQPLISLRDSARIPGRKLPTSAMDLPLWRSGGTIPPRIPQAPTLPPVPAKKVEKTEISTVAAAIVDHSARSRFEALRNDMSSACQEWGTDNADVFRTHLTGIFDDISELDTIAHGAGFHNAVARSLGRQMIHRELPWADALTALQALH